MNIPAVLFAYNRPEHLKRTLSCLRENKVPSIIAFSDGPRSVDILPDIENVRRILKGIDWCDVELTERDHNLGLGKSILQGVTEVLKKHEMCLVFEDDLICVPGTYEYLSSALLQYRDCLEVMSVTGWTHPIVTPAGVGGLPYFDGRAECWVWGTWARAWDGILKYSALEYVKLIERSGKDPAEYGYDLIRMAKMEMANNIWAVRFLYHQLVAGGLCLRPPYTMVQHIGAGADATNVSSGGWCDDAVLTTCPPIPNEWPIPQLNPECATLWRAMCGARQNTLSISQVVTRALQHPIRLMRSLFRD